MAIGIIVAFLILLVSTAEKIVYNIPNFGSCNLKLRDRYPSIKNSI